MILPLPGNTVAAHGPGAPQRMEKVTCSMGRRGAVASSKAILLTASVTRTSVRTECGPHISLGAWCQPRRVVSVYR
jgi:hypothetical protein